MALPLLLLCPPCLGSSVSPLKAATGHIGPSFSPQLQMSCFESWWLFLWEDAIWLPDLSAFTLA